MSSSPARYEVLQEPVIDLTVDSDPEELPDLTVSVTPEHVQNTTPTASVNSVRTVGSPTRRRRRTVRGLCRQVSSEREACVPSSAGVTNAESFLPSIVCSGRSLFSPGGGDTLSCAIEPTRDVSPAADHTTGSPQKARRGQKRRHCPRSCSPLNHKKQRCLEADQENVSCSLPTGQLHMTAPSLPVELHASAVEVTTDPSSIYEARDENFVGTNGSLLKLTQGEVAKLVQAMKTELLAVTKGAVFSHRHQTYLQGGRARRSLDHTTNIGHFTSGTEDMVMDVLMSFFKDIQIKNLDYLLRVLLPEALIRIHRHVTGKILL